MLFFFRFISSKVVAEPLTDYNCIAFTINTSFDISSLILVLHRIVGGCLALSLFTIIISLLYLINNSIYGNIVGCDNLRTVRI